MKLGFEDRLFQRIAKRPGVDGSLATRRARSGASIGVRRKKFSPNKPARKIKLLSQFNKSARRANHPKTLSSPSCKNISLNPSGKSSLQIRAIPSHTEGRIAIVTNAGWGAVDAAAFCARWDCRAGR
jgi:hypothetical protein